MTADRKAKVVLALCLAGMVLILGSIGVLIDVAIRQGSCAEPTIVETERPA